MWLCVCEEEGAGKEGEVDKNTGLSVVHLRPAGRLEGGVSVFQHLGHLPCKDVTTKVTISCCALVDGFLQVKIPETEIKS